MFQPITYANPSGNSPSQSHTGAYGGPHADTYKYTDPGSHSLTNAPIDAYSHTNVYAYTGAYPRSEVRRANPADEDGFTAWQTRHIGR